jgi:hypothetical protein
MYTYSVSALHYLQQCHYLSWSDKPNSTLTSTVDFLWWFQCREYSVGCSPYWWKKSCWVSFNPFKQMHTYALCLGFRTLSALDVTFCSPGLTVIQLKWSVLSYLYGSNHFQWNLHIATPSITSQHPNWINNADWTGFSQSVTFEYQ